MARMRLVIIDHSNKQIKVDLPDDVQIGRITTQLKKQLGWPESDDRGQLRVVLHHKASGRDLDSERTFGEEGVNSDDVIRARLEAVAG